MNPVNTAPKDRRIFMFFKRPTNWALTGAEVRWMEIGGPPRWAGAGEVGERPKYAVGWMEVPEVPDGK